MAIIFGIIVQKLHFDDIIAGIAHRPVGVAECFSYFKLYFQNSWLLADKSVMKPKFANKVINLSNWQGKVEKDIWNLSAKVNPDLTGENKVFNLRRKESY